MLKRFMIVVIVTTLVMAVKDTRASDTLELSPDNLTRIWRNINEVILVLSANIALDDEWIEELRNKQPAPAPAPPDGGLADELAAFREKLNIILASSSLAPVSAPQDNTAGGMAQNTSTLYMRSGVLLDNLIFYLIDSDSLAFAAIYYGGDDIDGASDKDVVAEINLANQRLDAFIIETGL